MPVRRENSRGAASLPFLSRALRIRERPTRLTSDVQEKGASRGKRSAAVIGGGAALGALIGGLAGGGKRCGDRSGCRRWGWNGGSSDDQGPAGEDPVGDTP